MSRPSARLGLVLAATLVTGSLTLGAGIAAAQAPPAPGTAECDALVRADPDVVAAQTAVDEASDTERPDAILALQQASALANGRQCAEPDSGSGSGAGADTGTGGGSGTGAGGTGGNTGTGAEDQPRRGGQESDGREQERGERERGGELNRGEGPAAGEGLSGVGQSVIDKDPSEVNCRDFRTQPAAQAYFEFVATPEDPDPAGLDRDNDGKACESLADLDGAEIAQVSDEDLDQTADDGSEPETTQVSEVPAGSVDTGSAW